MVLFAGVQQFAKFEKEPEPREVPNIENVARQKEIMMVSIERARRRKEEEEKALMSQREQALQKARELERLLEQARNDAAQNAETGNEAHPSANRRVEVLQRPRVDHPPIHSVHRTATDERAVDTRSTHDVQPSRPLVIQRRTLAETVRAGGEDRRPLLDGHADEVAHVQLHEIHLESRHHSNQMARPVLTAPSEPVFSRSSKQSGFDLVGVELVRVALADLLIPVAASLTLADLQKMKIALARPKEPVVLPKSTASLLDRIESSSVRKIDFMGPEPVSAPIDSPELRRSSDLTDNQSLSEHEMWNLSGLHSDPVTPTGTTPLPDEAAEMALSDSNVSHRRSQYAPSASELAYMMQANAQGYYPPMAYPPYHSYPMYTQRPVSYANYYPPSLPDGTARHYAHATSRSPDLYAYPSPYVMDGSARAGGGSAAAAAQYANYRASQQYHYQQALQNWRHRNMQPVARGGGGWYNGTYYPRAAPQYAAMQAAQMAALQSAPARPSEGGSLRPRFYRSKQFVRPRYDFQPQAAQDSSELGYSPASERSIQTAPPSGGLEPATDSFRFPSKESSD